MSRKNTREIELAFSKSRDPDWDRINDFLATTNERIVRGMV